jgi:hypothetical protein
LAYLLFYRPLGAWKQMIKEGGPIEQWKTERGRREMEAAAWRLQAIGNRHTAEGQRADGIRYTACGTDEELTAPVAGDKWRVASASERVIQNSETRVQTSDIRHPTSDRPIEVHVLTGNKFWYQTAFCLWSLAKASGREVWPVVHDDGSLRREQAVQLQHIFPGTRIEWIAEAEAKLDRLLPESRYPSLRRRRRELPLIKKITDVHLGAEGWTLFMDADLLFFRRPDYLLNWWDRPTQPLTSVDAEYAYGYSLELLEELAGAKVRPLINTGLSGHRSDAMDWDKMEYWCRTLIERAGTHYYQEQALIALHVAGQECAVLPPEDYITLPVSPEALDCKAVMHHYVAGSKPWYFRRNWRMILQERGQIL